jgi:hypothetical protein
MRRLIGTTLKALILAPMILWAAQADEVAKAEDAAKDEPAKQAPAPETQRAVTPPTATTPPAATTSTDRSSDIFVPSEEISEDLSVSYPVDI